MTVLVTGITGRIGSSLAGKLTAEGYDVRGIIRPGGRKPHPSLSAEVDIVEASLADAEALARATADIDIVVHLAAQLAPGTTPIDDYFETNVLGTIRLLEASVNRSTPVRRFIYASTDNTYCPSDPPAFALDEGQPQRPGDYYGTSKLLAEQAVLNYHRLHDLNYTILRYGSVVAPNEAPSFFRLEWTKGFIAEHIHAGRRSNLWKLFDGRTDLHAIIDRASDGRRDNPAVALAGPDGEPWSIHITDVRDVVSGTILAVEREEASSQIFNIGGPRTTTWAEAAEAIAKYYDIDLLTIEMPMRLAFEMSIDKARQQLGYEPKHDFADSVRTASEQGHSHEYVPVG